MSSSWLLRRCASPLAEARLRVSAAPYKSMSVLSSPLSTSSGSRPRVGASSSFLAASSPLLNSRTPFLPTGDGFASGKASPMLTIQLRRFYSPGRNPWQSDRDWKATLKTGGLVLLGTGALVATTSLAFGLIIAGAAGFGVYTLYQRFFGPYRSHFKSSVPFGGVNSHVDALKDMFSQNRNQQRTKSAVQNDLDSLVQGMPLVVRGFVKTVFSFVGKAMKSSMERAGELSRRTNEHLQANKRVRDQMGENVSVGGPEQWMESTVNGAGRIEAVFPVNGAYGAARVTMKASVSERGDLSFTELKFRNRQTGDVIDLLRDSHIGGRRKTVVDAEYVDLDDENNRSSRW